MSPARTEETGYVLETGRRKNVARRLMPFKVRGLGVTKHALGRGRCARARVSPALAAWHVRDTA